MGPNFKKAGVIYHNDPFGSTTKMISFRVITPNAAEPQPNKLKNRIAEIRGRG